MLIANDIPISVCFSRYHHIFILHSPKFVSHIHIPPLVIVAIADYRRCARHDAEDIGVIIISNANLFTVHCYKKTDAVFIIRITICPFKILRIICASAIIGALPINGTDFCDTKYITFGCARSITNNH